jgi:hypothetical protein
MIEVVLEGVDVIDLLGVLHQSGKMSVSCECTRMKGTYAQYKRTRETANGERLHGV